jgi:nucleotide-binding universal stress UspA family protein
VRSIRHTALGSISEYTARLAYCPVVVIPAPEPEQSR